MSISLNNHESRITALENKLNNGGSGGVVATRINRDRNIPLKKDLVINLTETLTNYDFYSLEVLYYHPEAKRYFNANVIFGPTSGYMSYETFLDMFVFDFPVSVTEFTISYVSNKYNNSGYTMSLLAVYGLKLKS